MWCSWKLARVPKLPLWLTPWAYTKYATRKRRWCPRWNRKCALNRIQISNMYLTFCCERPKSPRVWKPFMHRINITVTLFRPFTNLVTLLWHCMLMYRVCLLARELREGLKKTLVSRLKNKCHRALTYEFQTTHNYIIKSRSSQLLPPLLGRLSR